MVRGMEQAAGRAVAAVASAYHLHGRSSVHLRTIAFDAVERSDHTGRFVGFGEDHGGHATENPLHDCGRLRRWDWGCELRRATIETATATVEHDVGEGDEDTSFLGPNIQTWRRSSRRDVRKKFGWPARSRGIRGVVIGKIGIDGGEAGLLGWLGWVQVGSRKRATVGCCHVTVPLSRANCEQ